jgi:hypothetical protein
MSDSIYPKLLSQVQKLDKFAHDTRNDRDDIAKNITKLWRWMLGDRSLQEHRCLQSFLTFLYTSYGDDYASREDFTDDIKLNIGYCRVKTTKAVIDGQSVVFKKYKPFSLSFAECSQKKHNEVFKQIQEYALTRWGVEFDKWYSEWFNNNGLME